MADDWRELAERYDAEYYLGGHCGEPYHRGNPAWRELNAAIADRIVEDLAPRTALDVGCAIGFLVEALRERGVDARGIDASEWAIAQAPPELAPHVAVGSATEPLGGPYDLVVCIEVLEHLPEPLGELAVRRLAEASDCVLFSSSPDDLAEPTHLNVRPEEYWLALFRRAGLRPSRRLFAQTVAPHALFLERLPLRERARRRARQALAYLRSRYRSTMSSAGPTA